MSEFRQDRTNGAWVIIAPERLRRPRPQQPGHIETGPALAFDPSCPFCPGNERWLPGIIEETANDAPPRWRVRVVPNKYPAVRPDDVSPTPPADPGGIISGYGYHEVIVETPRHDAELSTLSRPHMHALLGVYRHRYAELMARAKIKSAIVFRNHGGRAGASLLHPHSQVVAIGIVPPRLGALVAWGREHYARHRHCATCEELAREIENGRRVVENTDRFLVIVPFAATSPFEQWILPKRHQASFAQIDEAELKELGNLLQQAVHRIKTLLSDPPYNYVVESGSWEGADATCVHWRLRIVPDLHRAGGFELGAGLPINPSQPENDAESLRTCVAYRRFI
jgi:UDPglucose--hexose-1-phosphate uridylyltransferase